MTTLEQAITLACKVHAGQLDKAGEPYILHPIRVMLRVQGETLRSIAMLHDVIEDSDMSADDLRTLGFDERIVQAVDALSRREGEDYFAYVQRAVSDPLAREVKQADLLDNLDSTRKTPPDEKHRERLEKYEKALQIITAGP